MSHGVNSINYPNSIDQFSVWEDGIDVCFAFIVDDIQEAIVNIEVELGTNPSGTYTTVVARLDAMGQEILNLINNNYGPWEDIGNYLKPRNDEGVQISDAGGVVPLAITSNTGSNDSFIVTNNGTSGLAFHIVQNFDVQTALFYKAATGFGDVVIITNDGQGTALLINQTSDGRAVRINKAGGTGNAFEISNSGAGYDILVNGVPIDLLWGGPSSNADSLHTHASSGDLKSDGSVQLTADWNVGPHKIVAARFQAETLSDPPFFTDSTMLVTNLNADFLDGHHSTDFMMADGSNTLLADWDAGLHKIIAQQFESTGVGMPPFIVASDYLVTNLNADLLDGKHLADITYQVVSDNDPFTDITGAELETLSDGSIADSLHTHTAAVFDTYRPNLNMLRPEANSPADDNVKITAGLYSQPGGDRMNIIPVDIQSGSFNTVSAPGKYRYDLLALDENGNVVINEGAEDDLPAGSPFIAGPDIPYNLMPIAFVFIDEDVSVVVDVSDITDIRPFLNTGNVSVGDYVRTDGTLPLLGDWDAGPYVITSYQFESDASPGTPPLVIASTDVVTNLNADLLDGLDETAFVLVNGTRELTGDWDAGSFKIKAEQLESDIISGTSPLIVASQTLVSNLNVDFLDGKHDYEIRANSSQELRVEIRTDDPVSPAAGRIWLRTDL